MVQIGVFLLAPKRIFLKIFSRSKKIPGCQVTITKIMKKNDKKNSEKNNNNNYNKIK